MKNRVITISREFGSGGRTIGKKVAEKMGGSIAAEYREGRLIVSLEFNECEQNKLTATTKGNCQLLYIHENQDTIFIAKNTP